MIPSDKGKSMSIMEYISDEPRDFEPYLAYILQDIQGRIDAWTNRADNPEVPGFATTRKSVLAHLDLYLFMIENAQRKLQREKAEEPQPVAARPCPDEDASPERLRDE